MWRVMHCKQVTVVNTNVFHTVSLDAQQVISAGMECVRFNLAIVLDILLGQYRFTRRHTTNHRQTVVLFFIKEANST